jgi:ABC-type arginine transport system ATPase subunit
LVYGCRQSRRKRNKLQAQQEQQTSSTHIDNYDLHLSQGQQGTSVHIGIEPATKAEPDVILYEPYKPDWSK